MREEGVDIVDPDRLQSDDPDKFVARKIDVDASCKFAISCEAAALFRTSQQRRILGIKARTPRRKRSNLVLDGPNPDRVCATKTQRYIESLPRIILPSEWLGYHKGSVGLVPPRACEGQHLPADFC